MELEFLQLFFIVNPEKATRDDIPATTYYSFLLFKKYD